MAYEKIKSTLEDGVAVITLSDPGTLNAAGVDLATELRVELNRLVDRDTGARCVILTGEGRGFSSGANLQGGVHAAAMGGAQAGPRDAGAALETCYNPLMSLMHDYPLPIITAVNGVTAGVGVSIALMGDLVVAAQSAYFLLAFRRIGLVPDGGATYLLSRAIGKARAMELCLLGEKLPAQTALEWGLINRCVPDGELMATAMGLARAVADGPKSLSVTRRLILDGLDATWDQQLWAERLGQKTAGRTEDSYEGIAAFQEKRPAAFKGR